MSGSLAETAAAPAAARLAISAGLSATPEPAHGARALPSSSGTIGYSHPQNARGSRTAPIRLNDKGAVSSAFQRALHRTRTGDPFLTMEVLYQLS